MRSYRIKCPERTKRWNRMMEIVDEKMCKQCGSLSCMCERMSRYPEHYRQELLHPTCPECVVNPRFVYWQDLPINPTIDLKPIRYAKIYHHTLHEALKVYGKHVGTTQLEGED